MIKPFTPEVQRMANKGSTARVLTFIGGRLRRERKLTKPEKSEKSESKNNPSATETKEE